MIYVYIYILMYIMYVTYTTLNAKSKRTMLDYKPEQLICYSVYSWEWGLLEQESQESKKVVQCIIEAPNTADHGRVDGNLVVGVGLSC